MDAWLSERFDGSVLPTSRQNECSSEFTWLRASIRELAVKEEEKRWRPQKGLEIALL